MIFKKPLHNRNWYPKHGIQSDATENPDGTWTLGRVRNFIYTRNGSGQENWEKEVTVSPARIVRTWYLLEPFTEWGAVAHPYFIFEYDNGSTICFTIEGKRLDGSGFSGIKGFLNEYELGYIWITEKDCFSMPLTHGAKALFLYPLTLSAEESSALCREFLRDTHSLYERPEFYNTLTNNCTGRFAKTLRRIGLRAPRDVSWYLPGYSDTYLQRITLIPKDMPLRDPAKDLTKRQEEVWNMLDTEGVARIKILG